MLELLAETVLDADEVREDEEVTGTQGDLAPTESAMARSRTRKKSEIFDLIVFFCLSTVSVSMQLAS